ncbi:MAG: HAMP domain-containing histidine kinase, partial [Deltaproteobacteria bacterium]|nr:HAMP domain-containing histidine kinase [Deltaproteobacteria bacterium]
LSYSLIRGVDNALESVARVTAERVEARSAGPFPPEIGEIFRRFFGFSPLDPYFQMLDPGDPSEGSSGTGGARELPLSKEALHNARRGKATFETVEEMEPYPVRVLTVPLMRGGRPVRVIRVGSSLRNVAETRARFLLVMGGLLPVGLLLAGLGGWVLARRALRPVGRMAEAAQRISAERLAERVEETGAGDELDRLAGTLNRMLSRLDEAFQQVRRFSADASHELQTPLTTLRGELEVALRTARTPEEYRETLRSGLEEIERISRLVEGLLILARAESGALRMDRRPVDLAGLVEEVFWRLKVLADERSVDLRMDAAEPVVVSGDRDRLRGLLVNLVDNAVKYTGEGGRVTLSLARDRDGALIEVSDTGRGIPEEVLERVFQPFYRSEEVLSEQGSGLGLSIARSIALAHGGEIAVESTPDRGSTFRVFLPV